MVGKNILRRSSGQIYRRSWNLAQRVREARQETAELVAPAITAVRSKLVRPSQPWSPWSKKAEPKATTTTPEPSASPSLRQARLSYRRGHSPRSRGNTGSLTRSAHGSLTRSSIARPRRSWSRVRSGNARLTSWAKKSRKEFSSLTHRLKKVTSAQENSDSVDSKRCSTCDGSEAPPATNEALPKAGAASSEETAAKKDCSCAHHDTAANAGEEMVYDFFFTFWSFWIFLSLFKMVRFRSFFHTYFFFVCYD